MPGQGFQEHYLEAAAVGGYSFTSQRLYARV